VGFLLHYTFIAHPALPDDELDGGLFLFIRS
jgi:hypothetical protein